MSMVFDGRPSDSPYIDLIWSARIETAGKFTSVAESHSEIVIMTRHGKSFITVRGPETRATPATYPADCETFGIVFKLGTFMPTFPAAMLTDRRDLTLPPAASRSFWLDGSAWQLPTFENADTFVNRLVRAGLLVHEPLVGSVLRGEWNGLSPRSIQRRFLRATGLSHGAVFQIDRARRAQTLLQFGTPILDVVDQLGYADQPHLTRALRRYVGQTPAQILHLNAASVSA